MSFNLRVKATRDQKNQMMGFGRGSKSGLHPLATACKNHGNYPSRRLLLICSCHPEGKNERERGRFSTFEVI
jgi:hypothetical protein